jgi:hypothetical protein
MEHTSRSTISNLLRWLAVIGGTASMAYLIWATAASNHLFRVSMPGLSPLPSYLESVLPEYFIPLFVCFIVAWKKPLTGGILLLIYGAVRVLNMFLMSLVIPLDSIAMAQGIRYSSIKYWPAPFIAAGILFLIYRLSSGSSEPDNSYSAKRRITVIVFPVLASIIMIIVWFTSRSAFTFSTGVAITSALLYSVVYILFVIALWVQPKWGAIGGIGFFLFYLVNVFWIHQGYRAVTQVISQNKYAFIGAALVLTGSILSLCFLRFKNEETVIEPPPEEPLPYKSSVNWDNLRK